jgi:uncharacterized membrane protein
VWVQHTKVRADVDFEQSIIDVTQALEGVAIVAVLAGLVLAVVVAVWLALKGKPREAYRSLRELFGRGLLFGLEVLVAADIIRTVTIDVTLESLAGLALLVLVRTFLSWSLDVEIEGYWPWQRAGYEAAARECEEAEAAQRETSS